jgi:threonine/homoserine/homoserine lactone efflux protein
MGQAIGQELVYGVAIGLSPIAIIGIVVMLSTPRGRSNGPAFLAGWIAGLLVAAGVFVLLFGGAGADEGVGKSDWVDVAKIVFGLALLVLGIKRRRRSRAAAGDRELPSWMRAADHFTAGRSVATGVGLAALNPKNLILLLAAATAIAETGASAGAQAVAVVVLALVGSIGVGVPVILYLTQGERADARLDRLRDWMIEHNGAAIAVICLIVGAKLIGDGISGLTA